MVAARQFREDLYYRLNVFRIRLPALRHRKGDVPLLVDYMLQRQAAAKKLKPKRLSDEALDALLAYDWPGNVRERRERRATRQRARQGRDDPPEGPPAGRPQPRRKPAATSAPAAAASAGPAASAAPAEASLGVSSALRRHLQAGPRRRRKVHPDRDRNGDDQAGDGGDARQPDCVPR
jgi:two-component system nitrogen regulation response regulator GlnG